MEVSGRVTADTLKLSNEETEALVCEPCQTDDLILPAFGFCQTCAEHLCETCYKSHLKAKPCRDHILLDKENMPRTKVVSNTPIKQPVHVPCTKHADTPTEFFCYDHKEVFCCVCSTLGHKLCKKEYISEISEQFVIGEEFKTKTKQLETILQTCLEIRERFQNDTDTLNQNCTAACAEVDAFRQKVIQELDKHVKDKKEAIEKVREQNYHQTTEIMNSCEIISSAVAKLKSSQDNLREYGKTDHLFISMMHATEAVQQYESAVKAYQETQVNTHIKFVPSKTLSHVLSSDVGFGIVRRSSMTKDSKATFVRNISVGMPDETCRCLVTGMVMTSSNTIIAADYGNKSLKVINTVNDKIVHRRQISSKPWDLTVVPGNRLAVTFPNEKCIQMFSTEDLTTLKKIGVNGKVSGITNNSETCIVTYTDTHECAILTFDGEIIKLISAGLSKPFYVDLLDESKIIISDGNNDRVLKVDAEGNVCGTYKHAALQAPRGVVHCNDGSFLVCSKDTDSVHLVSKECTQLKVLLTEKDDIKRPYAVLYKEQDIEIYVSCFSQNDEYDNFIKVFSCA